MDPGGCPSKKSGHPGGFRWVSIYDGKTGFSSTCLRTCFYLSLAGLKGNLSREIFFILSRGLKQMEVLRPPPPDSAVCANSARQLLALRESRPLRSVFGGCPGVSIFAVVGIGPASPPPPDPKKSTYRMGCFPVNQTSTGYLPGKTCLCSGCQLVAII